MTEPDLTPDAKALALLAARTADAKQGVDTLVMCVGEVLSITEVFVVTSAPNRRLVRTIADEVEKVVKEQLGRSPIRVEGVREQQWVLIDYGDVVVHVFAEEVRRFYEIERLYRDVPTIAWHESGAGPTAVEGPSDDAGPPDGAAG